MAKKKQEPAAQPVPEVFATETLPGVQVDNLKPVRTLTLDIASITKVQQIVMCCLSELTLMELPSKFAENGKAEAWTVDVFDVTRSTQYRLICNTILARELKNFGSPLKGQYFAVRIGDMVPGKRYRKTDVVVLERVG